MPENAVQKLRTYAAQLEAIGQWQADQAGHASPTATLLLESAKWLRKTALHTCGQGYIGCCGGEGCASDHK